MDCPVDGDAVVRSPESFVESAVAEQAVAAGIASLELSVDSWRSEVAARLDRYRARRKPRGPRYPSLRLPFDAADSWIPVSGSALAVSAAPPERHEEEVPHFTAQSPAIDEEPELFNNVIEFPRSAAMPAYHPNELAEPIFERPRIVEAPEIMPPPPALGGILLGPARVREPERRAADLALPPATIPRRMLAGLIDSLILVGALAGFGGMFVWLNSQPPPLPVAALAVGIVALVLWVSYEFLFTVYTGSTPGLRLAGLKLVKFDGSTPSRGLRRWRVFASYISLFALGLGYLWSILDEDGLCWHDRITHTHFS